MRTRRAPSPGPFSAAARSAVGGSAAARARPAVAARVAGAGPYHPAAAAAALDRVLPVVEERRLARRSELDRLGRAVVRGVGLGEPRADLQREDPRLLL